MRALFEFIFGKPEIDVAAELAALIDQKRAFIQERQQQKTAFRDKALWLKAQMNWVDDDIAKSEREIAALEKTRADLAGQPAIEAEAEAACLNDMEMRIGAAVEQMLAPKRASKRQKAEAEAV